MPFSSMPLRVPAPGSREALVPDAERPNSISARAKLDTPEGVRRFHDRADAGRQLAQRLDGFRGQDVVVLGLPRGRCAIAVDSSRVASPITSMRSQSDNPSNMRSSMAARSDKSHAPIPTSVYKV